MRRIACALAPLIAVLISSACAHAWVPVASYDLPAGGAGTCLRPAGVGLVSTFGAAGATTSTNRSFRVGDAAITPGPTTTLGWQMSCAEPSGGASPLLASAVWNGQSTVAAVAALGGSPTTFPAPPERAYAGPVAVAQAASGAAAVAWYESRSVREPGVTTYSSSDPPTARSRVVVAVRAPSAETFGAPIALSDWIEAPMAQFAGPAVGIDDAGDVVVAWAQAETNAATTRLATVAAGAAAPGPVRRFAGGQPPALAVASNGRALLATGNGDVLERPSPDAPFSQVPLLGVGGPADFAVALNPDGAAVIGRRGGTGVSVWLRPAGGAFGDEQVLVARADRSDGFVASQVLIGWVEDGEPQRPYPPADGTRNGDLHLVLTDDGRVVTTWMDGDRDSDGSAPTKLLAAEGRVDGTMTKPSPVSSPCLSPSDAYPILLADGQIGIVWTESVSKRPTSPTYSESTVLRLHLSLPGEPAPASPAPRLSARYVGPRALRADQPAAIQVRCAGAPCAVRVATSQEFGLPGDIDDRFGWDVNQLASPADATRRLPLTLFGSEERPQRKPKAHPIQVLACDAAGVVVARRTLSPVVRQVAARPRPRLRGLSAHRVGSTVVLRWQTVRPARGVTFLAYPEPANFASFADVAGHGRTHFRSVLRDVPRSARRITFRMIADGSDVLTVRVPIR